MILSLESDTHMCGTDTDIDQTLKKTLKKLTNKLEKQKYYKLIHNMCKYIVNKICDFKKKG